MIGRFRKTAGPRTYRRFLESLEDFMNSIVEENSLRGRDTVYDLTNFTRLRRHTSSMHTCLVLVPYGLDIDLPDEVMYHPAVSALHWGIADLVSWSNVSCRSLFCDCH